MDIVDLDGAALLANDPFTGAGIEGGQVTPARRSGAGRPGEMTERFAQVALPLPLASPYTYRIPETLGDRVVAGARVVVPVRRRELIGIVVGADAAATEAAARDILAAPDDETAIPAGLLETARWVAGYYGAPLGLTLKAMLPGGMWGESTVVAKLVRGASVPGGLAGDVIAWLEHRGGEAPVATAARALKRPLWDVLDRLARVGAVVLRVEPPDTEADALTERVASLAGDPPTLLERDGLFRRAPKQRRLYEALEQLGGSALVRHVVGQLGFTPTVLRGLEQRGLVRIGEAERVRDPFAGFPAVPPPSTLTADQEAALAAVQSVEPGDGAVLFGVTGSGKTLVVPRGRAPGAGRRTRRHRAGARDRPHAADGRAASAGRSATRWPCSTARCPTASGPTPGGCSAAASGAWRSAPAPRSSRRCGTSA